MSGGERTTPRDRMKVALLASVVATVVLYWVPYGRWLAYPLMLLSTLAHELGHGITALLMGGSFHRFQMWPDGSGVAVWSGDVGRLALAVIAAGGLVGPALAGALGFALARTARGARLSLRVAGGGLLLAELLVVRNLFGALFVALVAVSFWLVAQRSSDDVVQLFLVFISVQLALSVFSRGDYLFASVATTATGTIPSDTGQMAAALVLPFWFWGAVCGAVSLVVLVFGLRSYWR